MWSWLPAKDRYSGCLPGRENDLQRHPHIIRHLLIKDKSLKHPLIEFIFKRAGMGGGFEAKAPDCTNRPRYGFINVTKDVK